MAKQWSELQVGDYVVATEDSLGVTKGRKYKVESIDGQEKITFTDDAYDSHEASKNWVLVPYEEDKIWTKGSYGVGTIRFGEERSMQLTTTVQPDNTLKVVINKAPKENEVKVGQVRMDEDGLVVFITHGRTDNEDKPFNAVILNDTDEYDNLFGEINWYTGATKDEILREFPILVDAKLTVNEK